ncbi:MAG: Tm-1-like ATP-binding domain-containing protein [Thermodesulfobacteriota bacterium]|nr:Tm-1-like ATP-binding domain-containing protein [Thermodesulfobacteriota bacterium]
MAKSILIVSSLDTKGKEVEFLRGLVEQRGQSVIILDMSSLEEPFIRADITCKEVAKAGGASIDEIRNSGMNRDEITSIIIKGAIKKTDELFQAGKLSGIIGLGGVSNTTMATDVMKTLPFGVPKLMVSSGAAIPSYAGGFFGSSDIAILSSVADISGLNELTKSVLTRAAGAICGMVETGTGAIIDALKHTEVPLIAVTGFQYSERCSKLVSQYLEEKGYAVIPCHAQGVGDRAMDELFLQGIFDGVVDIVPSGLSDELFGGNRAAGPDRLMAAGEMGIPQVITPCGFEMISCGPLDRKDKGDSLWISRGIANRSYYVQDSRRVQARTNSEELRFVAKTVAERLNKAKGPVKIFIPKKGWSTLSVKGQPLHDPGADKVFAEELGKRLNPDIEVRELDVALNTPECAMAIAKTFYEMMKAKRIV